MAISPAEELFGWGINLDLVITGHIPLVPLNPVREVLVATVAWKQQPAHILVQDSALCSLSLSVSFEGVRRYFYQTINLV